MVWAGALFAAFAEDAPKIQFDRLVYDFGKTGQVETVTGTFRYWNEGDGVLRIKPPESSCGCTVASLKPDTLVPGETGELGFTFNLGKTRAMLEKHITVLSNDPASPEVRLVIRADYTPLYEAIPMMVSPLLARDGRPTNFLVALTRTDGKPLRIRKLEPSKPWITAALEPGPAGDRTNAGVRIEVRSDGQPRRFSEYVQVYDVAQTNSPVTMIYVYGQVLGDLALTPEAIYWDLPEPAKLKAPLADAIVTRRVTIRAVDGRRFELGNPRSTVPALELELTRQENGAAYELRAKLSNPPAQSLAGRVTLDSSVATQPSVEVPFVVHVAKP